MPQNSQNETERQRATDAEILVAVDYAMQQIAGALTTLALIGKEFGMNFSPSAKAEGEQQQEQDADANT